VKKIIISIAMMVFTVLNANITHDDYAHVKPLWEEEEHFCYYRTLCIEGSIGMISVLIEEARENPDDIENILNDMESWILNCKNSLGMPTN
jgi:hypothetical protein